MGQCISGSVHQWVSGRGRKITITSKWEVDNESVLFLTPTSKVDFGTSNRALRRGKWTLKILMTLASVLFLVVFHP